MSELPNNYWNFRSAGRYSDEESFNCYTDKYDLRKIRVPCPHCQSWASPLLSPKTRKFHSGWTWHGLDYEEPCDEFASQCRKCRGWYRFTVYTPQ
jgi:hypothetical protein